jgi:hypothetical protein
MDEVCSFLRSKTAAVSARLAIQSDAPFCRAAWPLLTK